MAKKNTPKRIFAGAMALLSVAASVPATAISPLVANYSIVANAVEVPIDTTGNATLKNRDASKVEIKNTSISGSPNTNITGTEEEGGLVSSNAISGDKAYTYTGSDFMTIPGENGVTVGSSADTATVTILNDFKINAETNIKIEGTVIINGGVINIKKNKSITVDKDAVLYLNGCTVTRENSTTDAFTTDAEALILNKGTLYVNASTVKDDTTYKYAEDEDFAAIRNTNATAKAVIGKGDVKTVKGFKQSTGSGNYDIFTEGVELGANTDSTITSTGAAIINGRGCELWVLGANISGTSKVLTGETTESREQGSVVPVVETSGTVTNFIDGSITDKDGAGYAVVAMAKGGQGNAENKKREVNFGDGAEADTNKFEVKGSVSVADMDVSEADANGTITVKVNKNATLGDVIMGLPGSECGAKSAEQSEENMNQDMYAGGNLVVDGGSVNKISQNRDYYTNKDSISNYKDDDLLANGKEVGNVTVSDGTVGSVDIPVNERTRDNVNITGGTVQTAAPEFYQHTYVVEKTETGEGDDAAVVFTLSCTDGKCGLKPVVVTVKRNTKVSQVQLDDTEYTKAPAAFIPSITVTGGDKAEATTVQWQKNASGNYDKFNAAALNEAIKAAIREHGLDILAKTEDTLTGNYMTVETIIAKGSGDNSNELGYPGSYGSSFAPEITISFDTQNVDGGTTTKKSENTKVTINAVAPSVLGFKVTNPVSFFKGSESDSPLSPDGTNYKMTYNTTGLPAELEITESYDDVDDYTGKGIDLYKDASYDAKLVAGTNKDLVYNGSATPGPKNLIKSIKAEFSSDNGKTWTATAKECGTYKVRYTLEFTGSEKTSLKWDADYTITINKAEFTAQAYAGNAKFNGVGESNKSTYVANFDNSDTHKVIKDADDGGSITDADLEIFNKWLVSGSALTETGKKVFGDGGTGKPNLVVGTIGQTLGGKGGIFSDVDVFNGETRQAGIDAEVYAKKVGTEEEFSASDPLTAGVFAVRAKLSEESSNYTMKDDVLGYVVVDGIDVKTASVTLPEYTFKYDGKKKQVDLDSMKVVVDGKQLEYGVDFQISGTYMAVKENTYVFTIEGDGDYCGTKEVVWKIAKDEDVAKSEGLKTSVRIDPNSKGKIDISAVREVPAGYEVVDAGLLISNDEKTTLEEFKAGKSNKSGVAINKSVAKYKGTGLAIYTFTLTTKSESYAVVSYMTVKNADGKKVTIYSADSDDGVTKISKQNLIDYNNHLDRSLFPIFTVENKDGNVNAFQFTAIRNVSEAFADAGYTVKEAGILMENETLAERAGRDFVKSETNKKGTLDKKLCADGDNTRKKDTANYTVGTATVKSTSLDSLVSSLKQSVTLNNPDMATNARAYLVISKGDKKYYYYSNQVNIGVYNKADASTASGEKGKRPITTIDAEGPTGNDVPKLTN